MALANRFRKVTSFIARDPTDPMSGWQALFMSFCLDFQKDMPYNPSMPTTHGMTKRQELLMRLQLCDRIAAEIRSNLAARKLKAGPQQAGDCGRDLRWLEQPHHIAHMAPPHMNGGNGV